MFRRPGTGRSKASADTLCQKCLKRGHYSYECKAPAQERPYKPRPSRTQQLLNPNLKPKLTTEVPVDLVRKKGVADDILKKKEEERKRARSLSTSSIDSVSTISTNRSPSRSRSPPRKKHDGPRHRANDDKTTWPTGTHGGELVPSVQASVVGGGPGRGQGPGQRARSDHKRTFEGDYHGT
ncbi:zf-CCHC-3 domain containing protein [Pyrenophora tritici-repentis]|uniref:Zf-CCHC-3 domain containing protein n=1 Tax=Pyrenophora tritici-repentis TaxID=45151 RepID=A0A2W1G6Q6_9PLEO|nr:zf-CCHC-3 domain-containing protein [Pyrenophora tritici-repentis]KAF7447860.1 zf-CCHC-3 domain containing protein [Pyrenophora tritici-repentis]KAF7571559.1 zf-CCHC-3 domain containing protein [Pyrenophora tritici-repentis]KAG9385214.1 zf-CCHC-3 domain containing protein [Pyrenophora tritici-repentis]KAI0573933.1 zf-CCHC-3 domain-containing protein [Pyrenophora tritici-repentis]